jgi:hypothetical protein
MSSPEPITVETKSWPGCVAVFILHALIIYTCAMNLSQWLVFHWFGWIAPAFNISIGIPPTDWYLQHFELATILPALAVGYLNVVRFLPAGTRCYLHELHSDSIATWAWSLPAIVLLYKILMYDSPSSVLVGTSVTAVGYFFDIQKVMPTFANPLASDPVRLWAQMSVTAPFYAGVAYSLGALASQHQLLTKIFAFEKHGDTTTPQEP